MKAKYVSLKPSRIRSHWRPDGMTYEYVKRSLPFLESFRGYYAHRVRHVTLLTFKGESHFVVKAWCSANFCVGGKGQTFFTENPTKNKPVCATCEGRFIGAGMDGDRVINGRKVEFRDY